MFDKLKSQVRTVQSNMKKDKPKVKTFSLTKEESLSTKIAREMLLEKEVELEKLDNIVDALRFKYGAWIAQLVSQKGISPTPDKIVNFDHKKHTMTVEFPPETKTGTSPQTAIPPANKELQDKIESIQKK